MNARLYDPALGRFFSPDPQVQAPISSQGFNRYSYCGNNPVMYTDPDGEFLQLIPLVAGIINLKIHSDEGDVKNFWQGLGYFTQGFIGGTLSLPTVPMNLGITAVSMIRGNSKNALRIFMGQYYYDENMAHGFLQAFTRFGIERLQTQMGFVYTQSRNFFRCVDRVDYFGGATYATDEYTEDHDGITLGNCINMRLNDKGIDNSISFREWCLEKDQMYLHEYGHTIQSQMFGTDYLLKMALPSLISCTLQPLLGNSHKSFFTETLANRLACGYFNEYYACGWNENKDPLYPFSPCWIDIPFTFLLLVL